MVWVNGQQSGGESRSYSSWSFQLPAGQQELTLESDAEEKPVRPREILDDARTPYSVQIGSIRVRNSP